MFWYKLLRMHMLCLVRMIEFVAQTHLHLEFL